MTFFHNLKLFLYEERILDVCDLEGNAACISSDTLLSQFFQYIIGAAKGEHGRNYTRLSFLMPDKRGGLALKRLQDLLPDYQVANVCSEAINCVYGEIIRRGDYEGEDLVRELAFHCGAGSSSLVCCDHEAENTRVAYKVQMKARYLNGASGFGGNRLTWRVMQYLKMTKSCRIPILMWTNMAAPERFTRDFMVCMSRRNRLSLPGLELRRPQSHGDARIFTDCGFWLKA